MLIVAFALFFLMLVSWMIMPGDRVSEPMVEKVPASDPAMVPAVS